MDASLEHRVLSNKDKQCEWPEPPTVPREKFLLTENKVTEIHMTIENKDNNHLLLTLKALLVYIYPAII